MGRNKISIVIPTFNRLRSLQHCLSLIDEQDTELLGKVIVAYQDSLHIPSGKRFNNIQNKVVYIKSDPMGSVRKRMLGLKEVVEDYVGFIDDDSFIQKNWVRNVIDTFERYPQVWAQLGKIEWAGNAKTKPTIDILPKLRQKTYDFRHIKFMDDTFKKALGTAISGDRDFPAIGLADHLSAGNCALRVSCFKEFGLFDTDFAVYYDKEYAYRLLMNHKLIAYNPEMVIRHDHNNSFKTAFKLSFFVPRHAIKLNRKYPYREWEKEFAKQADYFKQLEKRYAASLTPLEKGINTIIAINRKMVEMLYKNEKNNNTA